MKYVKIKYFISLIFISFLLSNLDTSEEANKILEHIISRYNKDISFKLTANINKINTIMEADIIWLGNDSINRKTWIRLLEPKDFEGVNVWIWNLANGDNNS